MTPTAATRGKSQPPPAIDAHESHGGAGSTPKNEPGSDRKTTGGAPLPPKKGRKWVAWTIGAGVIAAGAAAFVALRGGGDVLSVMSSDVPKTDGRVIVLTQTYRDRIGLKTVEVTHAPLTPVVKAVGTVTFDPEYVAAVGTRLRGLVRSVKRFEGDVVKKGDLLAEIDSPDLGSAQASVLMFRAQKTAAEKNHTREQDLASRGLTTAREVEEAGASLEEYRSKLIAAEQHVSALGGGKVTEQLGTVGVHQIRSPLDGTVVERHVSAGQSVESHLTAFRVANLDHLWVELAVFERNLRAMKKGDRVEILPLSSLDAAMVGQIANIGDQIDPATRTAAVRVEVLNEKRELRPGQAVSARIQASGSQRAAVAQIPLQSITYIDGKPTVFVAETDLRIVVTPVELGDADGEARHVLSGVTVGQQVVTEGVFALKSELFR